MLIPYLGEKSRFSDFIVPNIPRDILTYAEPFAGMYGIFFSLPLNEFIDVKFIYNDINQLNSNLFKNLKDKKFIDKISNIKADNKLYKKAIKGLINESDQSKVAINWLIVLNCSVLSNGYKSYKSNHTFEIFKQKYKYYYKYLNKIDEILNLDYKEVIEKYDSKDSFFYVDPPYYGKEKYYINHNFVEKSHIELANTLNNIKGRFALSYYLFDGLKDLYPNCSFKFKKTIMGTEYLIMNY